MIALILALCGALPDSVDAASPFVPAPTAVVPFEGAPQSPGVASGSDSAGTATLAPMAPLVLAPVPAAGLDSNGRLAPGAVQGTDSGVKAKKRHPFLIGAAGSLGGFFVGGIVGGAIGRQNQTKDDWGMAEIAGIIYGVWIGPGIGATWGVVHQRPPEKSGKPVIGPLLGGLLGSGTGLFMAKDSKSALAGLLILTSVSTLGAMAFDAGPAAPKPTTAFVPILEPQRTGLVLHTRF